MNNSGQGRGLNGEPCEPCSSRNLILVGPKHDMWKWETSLMQIIYIKGVFHVDPLLKQLMHLPLSFPCPADFRAHLQNSFCPTLSPVIESVNHSKCSSRSHVPQNSHVNTD